MGDVNTATVIKEAQQTCDDGADLLIIITLSDHNVNVVHTQANVA